MTLDDAIQYAEEEAKEQDKLCKRYDDASGYTRSHNKDIRTTDAKKCEKCAEEHRQLAEWLKDYKRMLEQQPCDDAISRQAVLDAISEWKQGMNLYKLIRDIPSAQLKTGHCKNCKYFEYDYVTDVDGIPLILAHEFCKRWGDGCKTTEDGYCFLYEPKESEDK